MKDLLVAFRLRILITSVNTWRMIIICKELYVKALYVWFFFFFCMILFKPHINPLNKRGDWGLWSDLSRATQTKLKPRPGLYWSPGSWLPDDPMLIVPGFGSQQSIAPNTVIRGPRKAEALAVKTEMHLWCWPASTHSCQAGFAFSAPGA